MSHSDQKSGQLSRRGLLRTTAGAVTLGGVASPYVMRKAQADTGGFDPKRFKGQHIEVLLTKNPRSDLFQKYEKEFEELTGIDVGSEQVPEQQQRQKQVIEFTSGATSFDATMVSWHVQKRLFGKGKWLADVRPWLKDPTLTPSDFAFDDFSSTAIGYATQPDGRIDTLPLNIDYWILYWNKELFAAKGIDYPEDFDSLVAAAKALTDPDNRVYGWVDRGLKNANVPVWTSFLLGWDVDPIGTDGVMHTDGPEAVAAGKIYQELSAKYAPPGIAGFNWYESQSNFMQGRAAMWLDGVGFAPPLEDKTKSRVAGKVGYGVMPKGPKAQHSAVFGGGMGVSAFSEKQGAAYYYCQWATGKKMQARMLGTGAGAPARDSAYSDKEALAGLKVPHAWVDAILGSSKIGRPGLPVIIPVTEFRDIFGVALTNMIGGADPKAQLTQATKEFKPVLAKSEKA